MPLLTDVQRKALGYWWDLITDFAQNGFTVTETVDAANNIARSVGQSISFEENAAISTLYGYSRRLYNSGNVLQNAEPGQYVNSDMMALAPYARDEAERNAYPMYHVKFEYTYIDQEGNRQTTFKTSAFPDVLPAEVGEVTAAVLDDAEGFASKYGHTLISAVPSMILVV